MRDPKSKANQSPPCGGCRWTRSVAMRVLGRVGAFSAALLGVSAANAVESVAPSATLPTDVIIVTATRTEQSVTDAPATVTVVSRSDIELRRNQRLGDVLADVPGLYVRSNTTGASFPSSAQASIAIRGVPRTTRTLVLVDGLPINSALSGGINLASVTVDELARVEVVRGPYSALYGGNAMAGVIHFITDAPRANAASVRLEHGLSGVQSSAATVKAAMRVNQRFAWSLLLGYRESDSWAKTDEVVKVPTLGNGITVVGAQLTSTPDGRPALLVGDKGARPWDQRNARLQFNVEPTNTDTIRASFTYADYRVGYTTPHTRLSDANGVAVFGGTVNAAPLLGRVLLAATDFAAFTPTTERDMRFASQWQRSFDDGGSMTAHLGVSRHQFNFAQPALGASFDGGLGTWTIQEDGRSEVDVSVRQPLTPQATVVFGGGLASLSLDRCDELAMSWRQAESRAQLLNRGEGRMRSGAAFVQLESLLSSRLTVYAGARWDKFVTDGSVAQYTTPSFDSRIGSRSLQQLSPKLALVFDIDPAWVVRSSVARGFRAPTLLDLYSRSASPTNVAGVVSVNEPSPNLHAESLDALEIGFERKQGSWRAGLTVFTQRLDGLIYRSRVTPTLTQSVNAGAAKIDGVETQLRVSFSGSWSGFANATRLVRAEVSNNPAVPASVGKTLTDVPTIQWNLGVSYERGPLSAAAYVRHTGHIFGSGDDNNLNTRQGVYGSYDSRTLTSLKLTYRATPWCRVSMSVDNLANRAYYDFGRQPGRNALIDVALTY